MFLFTFREFKQTAIFDNGSSRFEMLESALNVGDINITQIKLLIKFHLINILEHVVFSI